MKKRILSLLVLTICASVPNISANGGKVAVGAGLGLVGGVALSTLLNQKKSAVKRRKEDVKKQQKEIKKLQKEIDELKRKQREERNGK
jgi:peptidoglycan hydrolase CwlO-like protein